MPQSLSNILIHTVFSTKNREPWLSNCDLREECFAYVGGVARSQNCQPIIVGGYIDHLHLFTTLSRTLSVADFVKETKRVSSIWFKEEKGLSGFSWQQGYGCFSVSEGNADKVRQYILQQDSHHRKITFQEEYRTFLIRHGVEFDERYVWD